MTKKRIHLIYSILLSMTIVICGICLIVTCVELYDFQAGSFSRESVANAFDTIDIPLYCCLALVVGGFALDLFAPRERKKQKPEKQYDTIWHNLNQKLDLAKCEPGLAKAIQKKRTWRNIFTFATSFAAFCCAVRFICYAISGQNYPDDANAAVLQAMPVFLSSFALPCCLAVFTLYHKRVSLPKEIDLMKQALAAGATADTVPAKKEKKQTGTVIARYGILLFAVVIFVAGFCFGGMADVLAKAAAICTECVGLG